MKFSISMTPCSSKRVYHPQVELFHRSKTTMEMEGVKKWSGLVESKNSKKVKRDATGSALPAALALAPRAFCALVAQSSELRARESGGYGARRLLPSTVPFSVAAAFRRCPVLRLSCQFLPTLFVCLFLCFRMFTLRHFVKV
jgi:hypothetical protein